jgi:hypothetical protein
MASGLAPRTTTYNLFCGSGGAVGSNVITSDPQFVSASTGDYALRSTSLAINAGNPSTSATVVGVVDFAGNLRILGGRIDIGAYEAR